MTAGSADGLAPRGPLSYWIGTAPPGEPLPPLDGTVDVDVAVVGAGITGLTVATLLAAEGVKVAVIEARRLAVGTTGNTTAKVSALQGLVYSQIEGAFGVEGAARYAEANRAGVERVAVLAAERGIECELRRAAAYTYTEDADRVSEIEAEVEAARRAGLQVEYTAEGEPGLRVRAAVRLDDQLLFHPRRYCLGLADRLVRAGCALFEGTRVTGLEEDGERVVLTAPGGRVRAGRAILATLLPFPLAGAFFAKAAPSRSYALAVRVAGPAPEGMWLTAEQPTRSVRPHPAEGDPLLIVEGEEHKPGEDDDTRRRYEALESWARDRFDVRSIDYRWSAQDYTPADGVPYVGRMSEDSDRVLVATGFHKWGMSNGTAAAIMLSDLVLGRDNPWLALFDATRIKPGASASSLIKENVDVARRFVGDRLAAIRARPAADLAPGEGAIVTLDGERLAGHRDDDGALHLLDPVCTHLGCLVAWNTAERSWDCPCHGSRFDAQGRVLEGPAVRDLEPRGG